MQTLPLSPLTSRGSAAWAADQRPGCGQLATSRWGYALRGILLPFVQVNLLFVFDSDLIFSDSQANHFWI